MESQRILIVDDEPAFLFGMQRLLRKSGMAVDTAGTKDQAMELLEVKEYGAVVTDIMLDGTSKREGFEIAGFVKKHRLGTRVVVITGYADTESKRAAAKLGVYSYIEKPVDIAALRNVLSAYRVSTEEGDVESGHSGSAVATVVNAFARTGLAPLQASISEELCNGCGMCEQLCPSMFELVDGSAGLKTHKVPRENEDMSFDAMEECPMGAILLYE